MGNDIKVSIVIPTYNEEENIGKFLEATHRVLQSVHATHELIVVDDGSEDRTRQMVSELKTAIPELVLIERDNERGVASAIVRGYNMARGTYLGAMDADLAHDPKHLPEMLTLLDSEKTDFVIGSRYIAGSTFEGKPFIHKLASRVANNLIKVILGLRVKDTSNNYRVFRRAVWENIREKLHPDGNIMLTEIVYLAYKNNFRIVEVPTHYIERQAGTSKMRIFKESVKFFKNIFRIRFQR